MVALRGSGSRVASRFTIERFPVSSKAAVGVSRNRASTGSSFRGKRAVSSPIRAAARRLPGASCGPACASPGRCSRPGDPARLLRPWQRKRASAASDEQSDRQLSAGASRQTGPQLTSSTDSDSDLTRCAVREGSIPARTESGRPVWGMGRIRDSCAERLLCVQADCVGGVCGAPDWLTVRGSSLLGLNAITDAMPSQFGLGSLVRDRTDRVTVSEGRRLSCPGLSEPWPGDPRGGANGTGRGGAFEGVCG